MTFTTKKILENTIRNFFLNGQLAFMEPVLCSISLLLLLPLLLFSH